MTRYKLQFSKDAFSWHNADGEFEYIESCYDQAGKMFDEDEDLDFKILEFDSEFPSKILCSMKIYGYKFHKEKCPVCGGSVRHIDLVQTRDCRGIPYRYVCPNCYDNIMEEQGYDGEYYSEFDECIDYDY